MQPSKLFPTVTLLLTLSNTAACMATLPLVAPTTAPSPATFVVGLDGNATGTYAAGPAPALVHVSALGLIASGTGWLDERYAWDFGDAAGGQLVTDPRTGQPVSLNAALTGPVAAYLYELPGTYTVKLTRTTAAGATTLYSATVTVPKRVPSGAW